MRLNISLNSLKTHMQTSQNAMERQLERLSHHADDIITNLIVVCIILALTLFVARWLSGIARRIARRLANVGADRTVPEFFAQVVNWLVWLVGAVAILQRFGVSTTSIIAVLGAMSLAIGLALQSTLSNVATGILLLAQKPYRIGDIVTIGDTTGTVHRLGLFSTEITNGENNRVYIPNSKIFTDRIINISHNGTRRLELILDVDYDTDIDAAIELIRVVTRSHPHILKQPEIWVGVEAFRDSSVAIKFGAQTTVLDYGQVKADLLLDIKKAFDAHNISIPYPHQVTMERQPAHPQVTGSETTT
ncbi:MAG: mechanosensitive ion channel [Asticcacaulis sp.]